MLTIRENADYITMINYFTVAPKHQAGLMQVQMEDIELFGRKQAAMLAASFHQSLDGTRVFNYAHWASLEGLAEWRASADFNSHMARMAGFNFKVDPHPYQIVKVWSLNGLPTIAIGQATLPVLDMYYIAEADQARLVRILVNDLEENAAPPGRLAAWICQSLDGVRVAVYSQWHSEESYQAYTVSASFKALTQNLVELPYQVERNICGVGSVGVKAEAQI